MRITHVAISHFRSIKECHIDTGDMNILIGQNNHGKTNFLEAFEWFYKANTSPKYDHYRGDTTIPIVVSLTFSGPQTELAVMKNAKNRASIEKALGGADEVTVTKSSETHKRCFVLNGDLKKNPTGFDTALNDFLPKLEYVTTRVRLEDVSAYKTTTPLAKMLSGVLRQIMMDNDKYAAFKEKFDDLFGAEDSEIRVELDALGKSVETFLVKQFPEGTEITFSVSTPEFDDLLKNFDTEVDDGIKTLASKKGDGMQRALMLAILQAYAEFRKTRGVGRSFLFLLDEGELHLHPTGQRALKRALFDICTRGDQVFLNTHSSVLITDEGDNQCLFSAEKHGGDTHISAIRESDIYDIVFELLGGIRPEFCGKRKTA